MGSTQNFTCHQTIRSLTISLLILTISSLSHFTFQAEGRKLLDTHRHGDSPIESEKRGMLRSQIGSRPPRCEKDVVLVDIVKPFRFRQIPKLQMEIRTTLSTTTTKRPTTLPMRGTTTTQTTSL